MRAFEIANIQRKSMLSHNFDLMPSHKSSVFSPSSSLPSGAVVRSFSSESSKRKEAENNSLGA